MALYMIGFVFGLLLMAWPNVSGFFLMIWLLSGCFAYPYMFATVIITAIAPNSRWTYAYYTNYPASPVRNISAS